MIWGIPAVNLDLMYQAMLRETKARDNQMLYWTRLVDWRTQPLTPNTDFIYLTPYFDTKDVGPVVMEIPPAEDGVIVGTIMDAWQMPLEDVGPAGAERIRALNDVATQGHTFLDGKYKEMVANGAFAEGNRLAFPESLGLVFKASKAQLAIPNMYPVDAQCLPFSL